MASITLSCISEGSMMPQDGLDMASDSSRLAIEIIKTYGKYIMFAFVCISVIRTFKMV